MKKEGLMVNGNLKKLLVCGDGDQFEVFGELLWIKLGVGYLVRSSVSGGNIYKYICQYFVRMCGSGDDSDSDSCMVLLSETLQHFVK